MVQDADVGISADHLSHLFERFYKLDRFCWDVCTGLSLAIVQRMIEAHSREGQGKGREGGVMPSPCPSSKKLRFLFARSVAVDRQVHHEQFLSLPVRTEPVEGRTETILRHALSKSGQAININH